MMPIEPRLLANWIGNGWSIPEGKYAFIASESAADIAKSSVEVTTESKKLKP